MSQIAHVQVLSAYWMPLALAGLHLYFRDRHFRWLLLFAASWLMQALACGYYLFYLSVLVALWLAWFALGRERWATIIAVVAAWMVAGLAMAPDRLWLPHTAARVRPAPLAGRDRGVQRGHRERAEGA